MLIQNVTSDNRVQHVTRWVFTLNFTKIFLPLLLLSFLTLLHPHTEIQVRILMLDSFFFATHATSNVRNLAFICQIWNIIFVLCDVFNPDNIIQYTNQTIVRLGQTRSHCNIR